MGLATTVKQRQWVQVGDNSYVSAVQQGNQIRFHFMSKEGVFRLPKEYVGKEGLEQWLALPECERKILQRR